MVAVSNHHVGVEGNDGGHDVGTQSMKSNQIR